MTPPSRASGRVDARADAEAVDALVNALHMMENAHRHLRTRTSEQLGINATDLTAIGIMGDLGRITPKMLAAEISMTTGAVTTVIDRLVAAGHVARVPNPRDRRSVFLELTPAGTETVERMTASHREAAAVALRASPRLGSEETAEDIARAAVVMTAHTIDGPAAADGAA